MRSSTLDAASLTTGQSHLAFTVPGGMTFLVKSLYGAYTGATAADLRLYVQLPPANAFLIAQIKSPTGGTVRWEAWIALEPGWQFHVHNQAGDTFQYILSGSELEGFTPQRAVTKPA